MKYNKLIKICEEHNLYESDVIDCVNKFIRKGSKSKWLSDRFDLYVKERIKQKKDNYNHVWGSKIKAVKKVVVSNEYKQLNNCVYTLSKLIAEKHSKERLIQAFKNNGEKEMI
jgi:hypothetical protein